MSWKNKTLLELLVTNGVELPSLTEMKKLNDLVASIGGADVPISEVKVSDVLMEDGTLPSKRADVINAIKRLDYKKEINGDFSVLDDIRDGIKAQTIQTNLKKAVDMQVEVKSAFDAYKAKCSEMYKLLDTDANSETIANIMSVETESSFRLYSAKMTNEGEILCEFVQATPCVASGYVNGTHKSFDLGYMKVRLYIGKDGRLIGNNGKIEKIYPVYNTIVGQSDGWSKTFHPHISGGDNSMCYGDANNSEASVARNSGDAAKLLSIIDLVLRSLPRDGNHYLHVSDIERDDVLFNRHYNADKNMCAFLNVEYIEDNTISLIPDAMAALDAMYRINPANKDKYAKYNEDILELNSTDIPEIVISDAIGYIHREDLVQCVDVVSTDGAIFKVGDVVHIGNADIKHTELENLIKPISALSNTTRFLYEKSTGSVIVCGSGLMVYKLYAEDDDVVVERINDQTAVDVNDLFEVISMQSKSDRSILSLPVPVYVNKNDVVIKCTDDDDKETHMKIVTGYDTEKNEITIALEEATKVPKKVLAINEVL